MEAVPFLNAPWMSSQTLQQRAAGEMLFVEGEAAAGVYVLYSGEAELLFMTRDGDARPLRVVTSGHILGLSSVVMRRPHDCSAITRFPCEVGFIGRDELLASLDDAPELWIGVLRMLSSEVLAVYKDIRSGPGVTDVTTLDDGHHQSMVGSRLTSIHDSPH